MRVVETAILSTDLAMYFKKKSKFLELVDNGEFDWQSQEKKECKCYFIYWYLTDYLGVIAMILERRSSITSQSERTACDSGSLSTFAKASHRMGDQNLLSQAPPCFGRHVKPWVSAAFATVCTHTVSRRVDVRQATVRKNYYRIISQHDENMSYRPLLVG
jgi:hypothetical protein